MAISLRADHNDFNARLVKALGLEGQRVTSITIEAKVNSPVKVTVTKLLEQEDADELIEVLELLVLRSPDRGLGKG